MAIKYIQPEINGEKYDKYINGTLLNPKHMIEVAVNVDPLPHSNTLVVAYPLNDEEIKWKDSFGDVHTTRVIKGHGIAVDKKFIMSAI
jgi:hypothetical protein